MKRLIIGTLVFSITATAAFAQDVGAQGAMAVKKAKKIRDNSNAAQGIPNGNVPAPPAAAPAVAAPPPKPMDPARVALIEKVRTDLSEFKPGVKATADQKQGLENDCVALVIGSAKPSTEAVSKLSRDLAAALSNPTASPKDQAAKAKALNVLMNNAKITAPQAQAYIGVVEKQLKADGASDIDTTFVVNDLKAIVEEMQKNKPDL